MILSFNYMKPVRTTHSNLKPIWFLAQVEGWFVEAFKANHHPLRNLNPFLGKVLRCPSPVEGVSVEGSDFAFDFGDVAPSHSSVEAQAL